MRVRIERSYGAVVRVEGFPAGSLDLKMRRVLAAARMLQVWLLTRGVRAELVVSEGYGSIWMEWEGPPYIYVEYLVCPSQLGPCREPVDGEVEVFVLTSNPRTLRSIVHTIVKDLEYLERRVAREVS